MSIIVKDTGGAKLNPVAEGVHLARCVRVIDLGTQWSQLYARSTHKVLISWEVPGDTIMHEGEEKPKLISKEYTFTLHEKSTLRKHLEAWRGKKFSDTELKGFDLINVLEKPCQMQIIHNDNGYANIAALMAVPKGASVPSQYHNKIYFDLTDAQCLLMFDELPEWVKDKIKESPEYMNLTGGQVDSSEDMQEIDEEAESDLPF